MQKPTLVVFAEWEKVAAPVRTGDPPWAVQAYRLGLYAIECLAFDRRMSPAFARAAALEQLTRAIGSISANLAEGYSRQSVADRCRFYGYALGSTREAITWYDTVRIELGDIVDARQATLISIRRLLLTTLKKLRPNPTALHD